MPITELNKLIEKSRAVKKMCEISPEFKEKVNTFVALHQEVDNMQSRVYLSTNEEITLKEKKKEKLKLKSKICKEIQEYKNDSQLWIQTNGPSIIKQEAC